MLAEKFRNGDMCRLTEQVIFTDPYYAAPVNSHNPQIDELACALRSDQEAKIAASRLKVLAFLKISRWTRQFLLICLSATFETRKHQALTFRSGNKPVSMLLSLLHKKLLA